jgi:hypothetical protein
MKKEKIIQRKNYQKVQLLLKQYITRRLPGPKIYLTLSRLPRIPVVPSLAALYIPQRQQEPALQAMAQRILN